VTTPARRERSYSQLSYRCSLEDDITAQVQNDSPSKQLGDDGGNANSVAYQVLIAACEQWV
jgi:hypothetical protein